MIRVKNILSSNSHLRISSKVISITRINGVKCGGISVVWSYINSADCTTSSSMTIFVRITRRFGHLSIVVSLYRISPVHNYSDMHITFTYRAPIKQYIARYNICFIYLLTSRINNSVIKLTTTSIKRDCIAFTNNFSTIRNEIGTPRLCIPQIAFSFSKLRFCNTNHIFTR